LQNLFNQILLSENNFTRNAKIENTTDKFRPGGVVCILQNLLLKNLGDILNDNSNFDLKTNSKSKLCPILDFTHWRLCLPEQRLM